MEKRCKLKFIKTVMVMLSIAITILSACKKQETSRNAESLLSEYIYVPEFYSPNENIDTLSVFENTIYYGTSEGSFYVWGIGGGKKPEKMNISLPNVDRYDWGVIQPDFQGNFYIIYNIERYGKGEKIPPEELYDNAVFHDVYVAKYDAEGKELFCERLEAGLQSCYIYSTAVDMDGHLFILGLDEVFLYDTDCSYKEILENPYGTSSLQLASDEYGNVFIESFGNIRPISFDEGILEEEYKNFVGGNGFTSFAQDEFLTTMSGSLYQYNSTTQEKKEVLKWMNCNIDSAQVEKFATLKNGKIVAFLEDEENGITGEIAVLTKMAREDAPQKNIITIGTFNATESLMRSVVRFNKHNEEYRAEVIEYYDPSLDNSTDGSQKEEAYTRFHLDILSDRCPDILNLEYVDLQEYVDDGLFEDLEPYLRKSELDIMQNVIEAYTFDGKLLALPNTLKIHTIAGNAVQLGGKTKWTLKEWMDFIESNPDKNIIQTNAEKMLEYCLLLNQPVFVDKNKGVCDFTSESFYELLEFCSSFTNNSAYYGTSVKSVGNLSALLYELHLSEANDITLLKQLMKKAAFIGFPSFDGTTGTILEENGGSYAIASVSKYKDGAWSFIEMLMSDTVKVSFMSWSTGFPADKAARQEFFDMTIEDDPYDEWGGRNYKDVLIEGKVKLYNYVPLQEEVDVLLELLETAQFPKDYDENIMDIILEEAVRYFEGIKSVEEVSEIIQSRVTIYLNEHR